MSNIYKYGVPVGFDVNLCFLGLDLPFEIETESITLTIKILGGVMNSNKSRLLEFAPPTWEILASIEFAPPV